MNATLLADDKEYVRCKVGNYIAVVERSTMICKFFNIDIESAYSSLPFSGTMSINNYYWSHSLAHKTVTLNCANNVKSIVKTLQEVL